jgi:hypothetical protein
MKTCLLIALMGLLVVLVACSGAGSSVNDQSSPTSTLTEQQQLANFKALFFADQSLEEITKQVEKTNPPAADDPWSLFESSLAASRHGKVNEAKEPLRKVLADDETRIRLWAWKALRELGERPPANVADEVQGVVCELHNEAGVGTIAAYADGRARWLGGQEGVIGWEAPGSDTEIGALVTDLLRAAAPLVKTASLSDKHKTDEPPMEHFRVSVLTYAGIRTVEIFGPSIQEGDLVAPVLTASVKLLDAMAKKSEEQNKKASPR